jgi:hypothetical protein
MVVKNRRHDVPLYLSLALISPLAERDGAWEGYALERRPGGRAAALRCAAGVRDMVQVGIDESACQDSGIWLDSDQLLPSPRKAARCRSPFAFDHDVRARKHDVPACEGVRQSNEDVRRQPVRPVTWCVRSTRPQVEGFTSSRRQCPVSGRNQAQGK